MIIEPSRSRCNWWGFAVMRDASKPHKEHIAARRRVLATKHPVAHFGFKTEAEAVAAASVVELATGVEFVVFNHEYA